MVHFHVSEHFERVSDVYEKIVFSGSLGLEFISTYEKLLVLSFINKVRSRVLEIGIGSGRIGKFVTEHVNVKYFGGDISKRMIKIACKKSRNIYFTVFDGETGLPFIQNTFDYVVSIRVLKYIRNLDMLIKEVYRVLKEKGVFIFDFDNPISSLIITKHKISILRRFSIIKALLTSRNFEILFIHSYLRIPTLIYKYLNNEFLVKMLFKLELFLDRILPYWFLSKKIFVVATKR